MSTSNQLPVDVAEASFIASYEMKTDEGYVYLAGSSTVESEIIFYHFPEPTDFTKFGSIEFKVKPLIYAENQTAEFIISDSNGYDFKFFDSYRGVTHTQVYKAKSGFIRLTMANNRVTGTFEGVYNPLIDTPVAASDINIKGSFDFQVLNSDSKPLKYSKLIRKAH